MTDSCHQTNVPGEKDRSLECAAAAAGAPVAEGFGAPERQLMLELARRAITSFATHGAAPEVPPEDLAPALKQKRACFVTLTKAGALRGCIGSILAQEPLCQAVMANARSAAGRDPRFAPVRPEEVEQLKIEISVLTEPKPLPFASPEELLSQLQPHQDGVLLRIGSRMATFLPQVWTQIPDKAEFLNRLAQKAGCAPSAWRTRDTSVSVYRVECFEEPPTPPSHRDI